MYTKLLLALGFLLVSDTSFAQTRRVYPQYNTQYYQPRVVQPPRPYFSREQYQMGGGIVGGGVGQAYGGPYGGIVGGGVGQYMGGQAYDNQAARRYYYPSPYGTQTTTPYRTAPPRY